MWSGWFPGVLPRFLPPSSLVYLCKKYTEEGTKDIPFLDTSSKKHLPFFDSLTNPSDNRIGNIPWYELFRGLTRECVLPEVENSEYQITLIVDGLDELSKPEETVELLSKFMEFKPNKKYNQTNYYNIETCMLTAIQRDSKTF